MEYRAKIKELGHNCVLTPSIQGKEMTKEQLVSFWGLENGDVEWYKLYQVKDGKEIEL